jgi:hypothetical protein
MKYLPSLEAIAIQKYSTPPFREGAWTSQSGRKTGSAHALSSHGNTSAGGRSFAALKISVSDN